MHAPISSSPVDALCKSGLVFNVQDMGLLSSVLIDDLHHPTLMSTAMSVSAPGVGH